MKRELLTEEEMKALSEELVDWTVASTGLERSFSFDDFVQAFSFMAAAALHCERLNHHPEWSNVYGAVHVRLFTHDRNGVTDLDATLARQMENLSGG